MPTWLIIVGAAIILFLLYSHMKKTTVVVNQKGNAFSQDLGALTNAFTSIYNTVES